MNEWFGPPGGAPYEDDTPHVPTPVGEPCARCGEAFVEGDSGVTAPRLSDDGWSNVGYHYECNLRSVIGGLNHLLGRCTCCGGTEPPDPPFTTVRRAAVLAVQAWEAGLMFRHVIHEDSSEGRALLAAVEKEIKGCNDES